MAVLLDPRFALQQQVQVPPQQAPPQQPLNPTLSLNNPKVMRNQAILQSNMERQITSTMILIDRSTWHPPLLVPKSQDLLNWQLRGSVNVAKGEMYVRFDGPYNIKRSFCLQFSNILRTSKRHQNSGVWPPSQEMMEQCDDLGRWTISASVDPYNDIKATVVDPWDKAYLLTIPVKLVQIQR